MLDLGHFVALNAGLKLIIKNEWIVVITKSGKLSTVNPLAPTPTL